MLTLIVCGSNTVEFNRLSIDGLNEDIRKLAVLDSPVFNGRGSYHKYIHIGDCIEKIQASSGRMERSFKAESEIQRRLAYELVDTEIAIISSVITDDEDFILLDSVCNLLKRMGILSLCVVTKGSEGNGLTDIVFKWSIRELSGICSSFFVIPIEEYKEQLFQICTNINDMIHFNGVFNLNIGDLYEIFKDGRESYFIYSSASGENKVNRIIRDIFGEDRVIYKLRNARNVLVSINGNKNTTLYDLKEITDVMSYEVYEDAGFIFGTIINDTHIEDLKMSIIIN